MDVRALQSYVAQLAPYISPVARPRLLCIWSLCLRALGEDTENKYSEGSFFD